MPSNQVLELQERAGALYQSLLADPERPYWQVELTAILLAHADIMALLSSDFIACTGDLSSLKKAIESLETRYSELQYKMSCRT